MGRVTTRKRITRVTPNARAVRPDTVVVEEPLEIRVNNKPLAVTMRTPGADIELAQGFLFTEGIVSARRDIATIRYCAGADETGENTYNVLDIQLRPGVALPATGIDRNFYTTSSCGVCGKASLDAIRQRTQFPPQRDPVHIDAEVLGEMPATLRRAQRVFDTTGGLHAAALFDPEGRLLVCREDIGRHNAVDKVLGWAMENNHMPLRGRALLVSGRASFELAQKAVMAGVPILAAVSAPSSLAVELAQESGMTLIGFLRDAGMNIYSHNERISL